MLRRRELTLAAWAGAGLPLGARGAMPESDFASQARILADRPFVPPDSELPEALRRLDYDGYRRLIFLSPAPQLGAFRAMPFHRGYLFPKRIEIALKQGGVARPWPYDPAAWQDAPPGLPEIGYAGFRLLSELNAPGRWDEVVSFLGASYFRALGRGHAYGISARAVSVGLATDAEEFPLFRAFRIGGGAEEAQVEALLDGPSLAGAFRILVRPGSPTVTELHATLFPRRQMDGLGLAAFSSMFWFSGAWPGDPRPAVHDSDSLLFETAAGERVLRPLRNPAAPLVTDIPLASPRGFGLLQRRRGAAAFGDAEARYGHRPSLWAEPIGDWGEGTLRLFEMPARDEYHDNVALAWQPTNPPGPGEAFRTAWRLHWADDAPPRPGLARIAEASRDDGTVRLRFIGARLNDAIPVTQSAEIIHFKAAPGEASLALRPHGAARAFLARDGRALSETWWGDPA
ncbi:glucan biosynthesis protein [Sabulicella rubraurantiaca]|uniref:glucan biosynthesis protein n=1 Tax=Sabulicella rubraurantiaca TaxID=2811429 RepID=UPI001A969AC1|nr:glucan biosynthesis protein [Sabulicella rubraurantiaca]